jgi:hypothetical protein
MMHDYFGDSHSNIAGTAGLDFSEGAEYSGAAGTAKEKISYSWDRNKPEEPYNVYGFGLYNQQLYGETGWREMIKETAGLYGFCVCSYDNTLWWAYRQQHNNSN